MANSALEFECDKNYGGRQITGQDIPTLDCAAGRALEHGRDTGRDGTPKPVTRPEGGSMAAQGYSKVIKRPGYAFLLAAQALAVFDDNTFKQLLFFFALTTLTNPVARSQVIGLGTALYVLPYIFLS